VGGGRKGTATLTPPKTPRVQILGTKKKTPLVGHGVSSPAERKKPVTGEKYFLKVGGRKGGEESLSMFGAAEKGGTPVYKKN